ncbi:MAG: PQQ-like beta-propeller repeat protein [Armatimonadetes bacterium]|nr:PQQ-like beta-propeller repeat protein [Armatimonadota bacterium]
MSRMCTAVGGILPTALLLVVSATMPTRAEESRRPIWPTYRGNAQRTGQSPYRGPTQMRVKWEVPLGYEIVSAPVVGADGTLYAIAGLGVSALSPDGKVLWTHDFLKSGHAESFGGGSGAFPSASPALGPDGTLYVPVAIGGHILAMDPRPEADPRLIWARALRAKTRSSPLLRDGVCIMAITRGILAVDGAGNEKWRHGGTYYANSSFALSPDGATVYIGSTERELYAIAPETGERKWSAGPEGEGGIRLPERDAQGNIVRHFTTDGHIPEAPAVGPDGTVYFGSWDGHLYAAAPDGTVRWAIDLKDRVTTAPAIGADGRIVVSTFEGTLYAVRVVDGEPMVDWRVEANARYSSPLISADGKVYVGTMDGRLSAYALADGRKVGDLKLIEGWGAITPSPVPGGDGVLYIGGQDGLLRAIE